MAPLLFLGLLLAARDTWPPVAPAPAGDAWQAQCLARRDARTCICMNQTLLRSGEGQFVLASAEADADRTTLLARHGIDAAKARAFRKAIKMAPKDALAACR
ncbi:hypothetical protein IP88_07660 [alpha proteobacterium AAP81b]|nr:hypothetical protein IP88_07660 [alpha proteobacterium AAP81b]